MPRLWADNLGGLDEAADYSPTGTWNFGGAANFGDVTIGGTLSLGGSANAFNVVTGDGIGFSIVEGGTNGDSNLAILTYSPDGNLAIAGPKVSTDADVVLELKSGTGSTGNQSWIYLNGGHRVKTVTKTANYTVDIGDFCVAYTTLSAARTVTLPAISSVAAGWCCLVQDSTTGTHADTNNLTVQRAGSDLFVGGGTNTVINTANGWRLIMSINSRWQVIGTG